MSKTKIEWAEAVWNVVTGCTPISEGCQNCYAKRMAYRLRGRCGYPTDDPFRVTLHPEKLDEPLRWKKPMRVFVCSMGDLFHEDVPFDYIARVFDVMCAWRWPNKEAERLGDESLLEDPGHTFMILTKRPERVEELQGISESIYGLVSQSKTKLEPMNVYQYCCKFRRQSGLFRWNRCWGRWI